MKLADDPVAAGWLESLAGASEDFEWDAGNRSKSRKHGVEAEHVEAIFSGTYVFEGRIVEPKHEEPRWLLLGVDAGGRTLALVFTRRGQKVRAISCRPMHRKERKRYEEAIGGEETPTT